MDKNTYGKSRAAEVLVDLLNKRKDEKITRSVSSQLQQFNKGINGIVGIKEKELRNYVLRLYMEKRINNLNNTIIPDEIISYVRTVMVTHCKRNIKGENK